MAAHSYISSTINFKSGIKTGNCERQGVKARDAAPSTKEEGLVETWTLHKTHAIE